MIVKQVINSLYQSVNDYILIIVIFFIYVYFILKGDYFAVKIGEDPVYGTPVFTTLGGQSMCPGETMTNRREMSSYIDANGKVISGVEIVKIVDRCGITKNLPCTNLLPGQLAIFGVVIQNLSPTSMYFIMLYYFCFKILYLL